MKSERRVSSERRERVSAISHFFFSLLSSLAMSDPRIELTCAGCGTFPCTDECEVEESSASDSDSSDEGHHPECAENCQRCQHCGGNLPDSTCYEHKNCDPCQCSCSSEEEEESEEEEDTESVTTQQQLSRE